jgi:hypothetical protein
MTPCLFQHHAGWGWTSIPPGVIFSNRPKKMRHTSPSFGGSDRPFASHSIPFQGMSQPHEIVAVIPILSTAADAHNRQPSRLMVDNATSVG